MALFREHRRSLEESLKTTVIVHTKQDIAKIIIDSFVTTLTLDEVLSTLEIKAYEFDHRIGWYEQLVSFIFMQETVAVGFLSEPLVKELLSPLRKKLTDFYSDETQLALIEILGEPKDD